MKSNKIFCIKELYLNLPDDFNGSTLDALKLLVKVREDAELNGSVTLSNQDLNIDNYELLWQTEDKKCCISSALYKLNDDNEWEYLNLL